MHTLSSGQGLAGRLLNDPTLYDRLDKLTSDLAAILDDVRKDPRKYTKGAISVCVLHSCK
jgi:phospholipid/cholesterol/gamma-HCH transport system substrate-binding protein